MSLQAHASGWTDETAHGVLLRMFEAAIGSADPRCVLQGSLPEKPRGRCVVVGAGKAAAAMAAAVEAAWPDVALSGVVVAPYGHTVVTQRIEVIQASHPVPDENSERGARRLLAEVSGLRADDLVLALISGGGSALLALPADGLALADKQDVARALLASGAAIGEMNALRRQLSAIKGGKLAQAAAPARVVTLAISDVPGDDPAIIASGPTIFSPGDAEASRRIVARYRIALPPRVEAFLARAAPSSSTTAAEDVRLIATPAMALRAAAAVAHHAGIATLILGDAIEGESSALGGFMSCVARSVRDHGEPASTPVILLSGGETTVTIGDGKPGRGGRNTEFLLSLAIQLRGLKRIWALAGDTDGIDGSENAAGAWLTPDTLDRVRAAGLDAREMLDRHDSYTLFAAIGNLVVTGPTNTNVNDFRAILIA